MHVWSGFCTNLLIPNIIPYSNTASKVGACIPINHASIELKPLLDHSSLLRTFGLNATSTYDSYLPLIFGKFVLIWGHFQNVSVCRFRGRWGCRGQTTSKSKTTKILNENLLKLDEIQILASAISKMTSWPQRPRKGLGGFFQKIHFKISRSSWEKWAIAWLSGQTFKISNFLAASRTEG